MHTVSLRISADWGKTWKWDNTMTAGLATTYPAIVRISRNIIGVLHKKDSYSTVIFTLAKIDIR
ncbi:hypothetical protein EGT74_06125 [Chitinophaga lutea]|uniref:Exo-alpha-sialidase n=1 Tax=Chitinophaga lutea TaxID=2488634 RepID=A0A3N4PYS5_9BACT|nr:hypothetical protein EGT74_06125 [Chitinophaga lutea]